MKIYLEVWNFCPEFYNDFQCRGMKMYTFWKGTWLCRYFIRPLALPRSRLSDLCLNYFSRFPRCVNKVNSLGCAWVPSVWRSVLAQPRVCYLYITKTVTCTTIVACKLTESQRYLAGKRFHLSKRGPVTYSWFSRDVRKKLKLNILSFYTCICWPVFSSTDRCVLITEYGFFTMRDIGIVSG